MSLELIAGDITKMNVDIIVNAANSTLLGGGGVDGAIHRAAGKELLEECKNLGGCREGHAKITGGYLLPAKYVIHTVGPIYSGGGRNEETILADCYSNSLRLAKEYGAKSIAFPVISAGAYGYPKKEALDIAVRTIISNIHQEDISAYVVLFDEELIKIAKETYPELAKQGFQGKN